MIRYLTAAILIILAVYGTVKAWPLLAGPTLLIESPLEGQSFPDGVTPIRGISTRIAKLTLNGEMLLHNEAGQFETTLTFPLGASILTFVATDRFGRSVTVTRTIFVPITPNP